MAKVVTTFSSDDKEVQAAIDRMNKNVDALTEKNRKLAEASAQSSKQAAGGFDRMVNSAAQAVLAHMSVAGAIELVNAHLRDQAELEAEIAKYHHDTAIQEKQFRLNLGLVPPEQRAKAQQDIKDVSAQLKVPESELYGPFSAALTGSNGDLEQTKKAVTEAGKIAKGLPQEFEQLAFAIANLGKVTDGDMNKSLGLLVGIGQTSNVKSWAQIASNAPKGVIGGVNFGMNPETSAAMYATITQSSADDTGATSATGNLALARAQREFFPEEDVYKKVGNKRVLKRKGVGKMSGDEQLDKLFNDEKLRKEFLSELDAGENYAAIEKILTPGTRDHAMFQDIRSKIHDSIANDSAAEFGKVIDEGPLQQGMVAEQALDRVTQNAQLGMYDEATRNRVRKSTGDALRLGGVWYPGQVVLDKDFDFHEDPFNVAYNQLNQQLAEVRGGRGLLFSPSEKSLAQEKVLEDMLAELKNLEATLKGIKSNQRSSNENAAKEER